ncbi:MAG: HK97 family phage prohead protease [Halioglobus sp.]|nr:HK97 family phage prohead protease [Halioglobus sp.]|tara:strand:- start:995 stop:1600 length:606 start_codon:yes stop_codon:yes gene_type:complete
MLFGAIAGDLEVRRKGGSTRLSGSFPYNSLATLSDGGRRGRPRKERFAPGAFQYSVESGELDIHLLVGHDFGKPLASKDAGSLLLRSTDDGLFFKATISDEVLNTSHGKDAMSMLSAGLIGGISPGFRIPPERTVPNAETVEDEDPSEGTAIIRTVNDAILYELSLVTRPAYPDTTVEERNWQTSPDKLTPGISIPAYRWR